MATTSTTAAAAAASAPPPSLPPVDCLMVGTGEYTTGYVDGGASKSDKGSGVVALTLIDLRSRLGSVGRLALAGVRGAKLPGIRAHMQAAIAERYPASAFDMAMDTFPAATESDAHAYRAALTVLPRGSAVTVFTPDDTHYDIAMECVAAGMHVLVAKPIVKTLAQHRALMAAARENNVLVLTEVHKRFDPFYTDCRDRIATLGDFSFMHAYMSQPKMQLQTFSSWLGSGASDISYYLNCHHIDFHEVPASQRVSRVEWC